MAFVKKTWQARIGTGLNKFRVGDLGTFELTNTPDEITQQGDALSASNLNDLENRIDTGCVQDVRTPDGTSLVSGGVATINTNKGISSTGGVIGHSNSIVAQASSLLRAFAFDAEGHITNSTGYSVADSTSASAIGTGQSIPTERDIYYGLPQFNGDHSYTSDTNYYVAKTLSISSTNSGGMAIGGSLKIEWGCETSTISPGSSFLIEFKKFKFGNGASYYPCVICVPEFNSFPNNGSWGVDYATWTGFSFRNATDGTVGKVFWLAIGTGTAK